MWGKISCQFDKTVYIKLLYERFFFGTLAIYEGEGTLQVVGKTMTTIATMKPHCDKTKWTCKVDITYKHKTCPQQCKADVNIDYSQEDRLGINTKYDNKEINNEIRVEDKGRTLRIINTWDKVCSNTKVDIGCI